jgi:ParB-like chromosome segregation protein Spo0J
LKGIGVQITDVIIDEEFEGFLPSLSADEYAGLKASVASDGFTDPLIAWQHHGELIDGYNRYRLWLENGADQNKAPDIIERKFTDRAAVMKWMFERQAARRNWTAAQRATVALKMKPAIEEKAAENKGGRPTGEKPSKTREKKPVTNSSQVSREKTTRAKVAKIAGVSEDTVRKTEAVLKDGTPEVKAAMAAGEMSANQAFKETKKPKNGAPVQATFDDKGKIDKPIGQIRRALDDRLEKFPGTDRFFNKAKYALGELQNIMVEWREAGKK